MMYYKVVRSQGCVKQSVVPQPFVVCEHKYTLNRNPWCLQYDLNITTIPNPYFPGSKLFVFNDLDCAMSWTKTLEADAPEYVAYLIYECQVENPVVAHYRSIHTDNSGLTAFWKNVGNGSKTSKWKTEVPSGTCWVDSVTLTKLVKVHDPAA